MIAGLAVLGGAAIGCGGSPSIPRDAGHDGMSAKGGAGGIGRRRHRWLGREHPRVAQVGRLRAAQVDGWRGRCSPSQRSGWRGGCGGVGGTAGAAGGSGVAGAAGAAGASGGAGAAGAGGAAGAAGAGGAAGAAGAGGAAGAAGGSGVAGAAGAAGASGAAGTAAGSGGAGGTAGAPARAEPPARRATGGLAGVRGGASGSQALRMPVRWTPESDDGGAAIDAPVATVYSGLTDHSKWTEFGISPVANESTRFSGGTFDGRYVYFAPVASYSYEGEDSLFVRYDTQSQFSAAGTWQTLNTHDLGLDTVSFAGSVFDGRYATTSPRARTGSGDARAGDPADPLRYARRLHGPRLLAPPRDDHLDLHRRRVRRPVHLPRSCSQLRRRRTHRHAGRLRERGRVDYLRALPVFDAPNTATGAACSTVATSTCR